REGAHDLGEDLDGGAGHDQSVARYYPAFIGVWKSNSCVGGSYPIVCAMVRARTPSSVVMSGVVLIALIPPPADAAIETAVATTSSGSSTMETTSKSPNVR